MKKFLLILLFSCTLLVTPAAIAQTKITPNAALERLFTTEKVQLEWFDKSFLRQVPVSQLELILDNIEANLGDYENVVREGNNYQVIFSRGRIPASISLNAQGQITGLFFQPPIADNLSLQDAVESFQALSGEVSFLVLQDNVPLVELNSDRPLAVGSAFKLAILQALQEQIAAGKYSWQEVVELQPEDKSLPSGILQDWPDYSPLTLQTLATLMISQSDNTATDILLRLVGREAVEELTPHNRPFLSTREAFILKNPENSRLLRRYRNGNVLQRRQLLQELQDAPLPDVELFLGEPVATDVEWFFSSEELCQLMAGVADLPLLGVNPGLAVARDWQRVAFKGGSEPGVLNLTTWLEGKDGKTYCLVASWNDTKVLDETRFYQLYRGVIETLVQNSQSQ